MKKIELQNQISLYSLDTKDFYNNEEKILGDELMSIQLQIKKDSEEIKKVTKLLKKIESQELIDDSRVKVLELWLAFLKDSLAYNKKDRSYYQFLLKTEIENDNNKKIRALNKESLKPHKVVNLFESTLTRTCGIKKDSLTEELFIIRAYHYDILESIIRRGFLYDGEHYQYFTSSAGQIRTKKIVCIKTKTFTKYENSITCGLTKKKINKKGGVNTNKYQAYLALINSASARWKGFNIDKAIVVEDMCTDVFAEVDEIDIETYEISRKKRHLPIEHMDGCGIVLPSVSDKTFMFRMPWVKGMLVPFPFNDFAKSNTKIKDIYGKEYDIVEDDIQIILTKSQFKMWKYYCSWDKYKEDFKKYSCEASYLNLEDVEAEANLNYQMLQTLVNITDSELKELAQSTVDIINEVGTDKKVMLRLLGATKENKNKSNLQEALLLYPELLNEKHCREIVKNNRNKLIKEAKSGKLKINGKYTFLIPDLYAFCEWLFENEPNPQGLLKNGEVYCNIFNEGEVDVLRAPHLYKEHAVRNNIIDEEKGKWFITKGVYTSVHDPISRILQFDK